MIDWTVAYPYLELLLYAMALDVLTGVLRAIADKVINSDICGKGMRKKAAMLIMVLGAYAFQRIAGDAPIGSYLTVGFIIYEAISITENSIKLGAPVPKWFKNVFLDLKEYSDGMFRLGDSPREYDRIIEKRKESDPVEKTIE